MGAFEDRLEAGYRQAANTPAKKPQPTTPTGKRFFRGTETHGNNGGYITKRDILAIEQEAAAQIAERVEAEWYNGNMSEATMDRILGDAVPRVEAAAAERSRLRGGGVSERGPQKDQYTDGPQMTPTTPTDYQITDLIIALDDIYNVQSVGDLDLFIKQARQEAAAAERRRLLEVHMADHDDATGWCPTCALLTEDER